MSSNAYTVNIVNAEELYVAGDKISGFNLAAVKAVGSNVGLNTDYPKLQLDISGVGAIRIPAGTTPDRNLINNQLISTGGATDLLGVLRYNKTTSRYEAIYEHTGGQEPKWGNFVMEDSSGNVGIGTISPSTTLDVSGIFYNSISSGDTIAKFSRVDTDTHIRISGHLGYGTLKSSKKLNFQAGDNTNSVGSHMLINTNGNVGIGTDNPGAKLDVSGNCKITEGSLVMDGKTHSGSSTLRSDYTLQIGKAGTRNYKKLLYVGGLGKSNYGQVAVFESETDNASYTFRPFEFRAKFPTSWNAGRASNGASIFMIDNICEGDSSGTYYNEGSNFLVGNNLYSANRTVIFNVKQNGNVGIGTNNPSYPLEIYGSYNGAFNHNQSVTLYGVSLPIYNSTHTWSGTWFTNLYGFPTISLKTQNGIYCGGQLFITSDERIKTNIQDVSDNIALQQLRDISCCFYEYKDKVIKGTEKTIGFIAQQVRENMPMAVSIQKGIIPNEMRNIENPQWTTLTDASGNNTYKLTIPDLEDSSGNTGETTKYRFYVSNDPSGNDECEKEITSLENDPKSFIFEEQWQNVFLYGKEIDDFHTLDKQKLFALNFSATQEIDRIQQQEKVKLEEQTSKLEEQTSKLEEQTTKLTEAQAEIASLKTTLADVLSRLAALEGN